MNALISHAIAAKLILAATITALAVALSGCTAARFAEACIRGSLSCQ